MDPNRTKPHGIGNDHDEDEEEDEEGQPQQGKIRLGAVGG